MLGFKPREKDNGRGTAAKGEGPGFHPEQYRAMRQASDAAAKEPGQGPGLGFHPGRRQAPDSIPAMVAPGEFILPPDTVHAMGGKEALNQVVQATHTPAPVNADVPRGFHPQMFFANGGAPEDQPRSNSFGDAAAAAADRSVTQVQAAAPTAPTAPKPVSPTNAFPQASPSAGANVYGGAGKELGSSGTFATGAESVIGAQPPKPPAPAPAQAAASPRPAAQSAGLSYMDNNESVGRGIKDSWNKGNYGEAVGKTVAGTVGMFTNPLIDGAAGAFEGAKGVGRGLFGIESPAQAPAPTSTTAPGAQAGAGAGRGVVNPSMAEPSKPLPQPGPANTPSGAEVMPGVYQHGRGQYSDSAAGMGMPAGFTGKPSAQNMAAAENLALGFKPRSAGASAPEQPGLGFHPGMAAPQVAHSGNSWSAQNALRNAQVSASSIMNNGGSWDKHKGVSPERAYAAAMENADFAARGAQAGMNQAAMRENAATQREGMQQTGSTARAQMQEVGQNNRFGQTQGLARDKFGLEQETQGFSNRAAAQSEQLRNQIMQEKDPAKRQSAVQRMREMQGTQQADPYLVVPGGQQIDPTSQRAYNTPASVFNRQTGQWVQQPGQGGAATVSTPEQLASLPSGAVYVGPDGKQYRKN